MADFLAIFVLCLIIVPLSIYMSTKDYQARLNSYHESVRLYDETHKTIADIYLNGAKVFRSPSSLSFISLGLEIVMPNVAETEKTALSNQAELKTNNDEGPVNFYGYIQGPLDISFIITIVMTFFSIVLSFGSVSGERENGTLKQILSNSVPRHYIIFAKLGASFISLILPFISALLLSMVILHGIGNVLTSSSGIGSNLALAFVFSILTICVFLNLGVLVSSLTRYASVTRWSLFYAGVSFMVSSQDLARWWANWHTQRNLSSM